MEDRLRPHFPELIETARLIIRPPHPDDGAEVNAAIRETFADLHRWMNWASYLPSVAETEQRRQHAYEAWLAGKDFNVQAHLKTTGVLAVCAGLHPLDWNVPKFEIGYWCRARYQGYGYLTETVWALTQVGFETFAAKRIEIRCDERNIRSRQVAERAGYSLEAILKHDQIAPDGSVRNTLIFAMLPEQYHGL